MASETIKDIEKVTEVENFNRYVNLGLTHEETEFFEKYPAEARKKLLWKVDIRLIPFLALLYLAAHIDRA